MLHRTEGIVLKNTPYGEADLLVTFLTKDFGLINTFAKSPRKVKSRFGSSLEPLTYSRISFWAKEHTSLPRLTQSDIIKPFQELRENFSCFLRLSEIAELTCNFLPEGEANIRVFFLLKEIMEMMQSSCSALNTLVYKIKFLELTGYAPRLKGCARCGRSGQGFYVSQGSVICGACLDKLDEVSDKKGVVTLSAGSIRLYETLKAWDVSKTARIKVSENMLSELSGMLDAHIECTLSRPIRTKTFRKETVPFPCSRV